MGLDMYLNARKYISNHEWDRSAEPETLTKILGTLDFSPSDLESPRVTVELPVGYWRKANQIHNWFVVNIQNGEDDCKTYEVDREQLAELKDLCDEVLENPEKAEDLLPTSDGFFFGSTDYDEYYLEDLRYTSRLIAKLLDDTRLASGNTYFTYTSSW